MEHEPLQGSHLSFVCNFAYECESRHPFFVCKYTFDIVWIDWLNLLCTRRTQHCIFIARPKFKTSLSLFFISFPLFGYSHRILFSVRVSVVHGFAHFTIVWAFGISSALFVLYFKRIGQRVFSQSVVLFFLGKLKIWPQYGRIVFSLIAPSPPLQRLCLRRNHRWILFTWRHRHGHDSALCVKQFSALQIFSQLELLITPRIVCSWNVKMFFELQHIADCLKEQLFSPFSSNLFVLASKTVRNKNDRKNNMMLIAICNSSSKKK